MQFLKELFNLNRVVALIISGEFILTTSFGFLAPVFSLFVVNEIKGGSPQMVGFALAIYWVTKSILQLPIARWLDKNHGEIDDFWALVGGNIANGILAILFFILAREAWQVYLFEFLFGVADSFLVPPFYAIFSRHLDPGHEGFEWSLRSSFSLGAGSALGGAVGGWLAGIFGFRTIFLFTGIGALLGAAVLILLKPYIKPKVAPLAERVFIEPRRL